MSEISLKTKQATEKDCLKLANILIEKCHIPIPRICSMSEINSFLIQSIYNHISDINLPELISHVKTIEDEIHNVQAIIDSLSLDLINMSLSHISGNDVIHGHTQACYDLLEVFHGYYKCVIENDEVNFTELSSIPPLEPSIVLKSPVTIPHTSDFKSIGDPHHRSRQLCDDQPMIRGHFTHHLYHHNTSNKNTSSNRSDGKRCSQKASYGRLRLRSKSFDDVSKKCCENEILSHVNVSRLGLHEDKNVLRRLGSVYEVQNIRPPLVLKQTRSFNNLYFEDFKNIRDRLEDNKRQVSQQKKNTEKQHKHITRKHLGLVSTPIRRRSDFSGKYCQKKPPLRKFAYKNEVSTKARNNGSCGPHISSMQFSKSAMKHVEEVAHKYAVNHLKSSFRKPGLNKESRMFDEALKKQKLISDIVKKDLDHSKRMKDMKATKVSQIKANNLIRDKKIQKLRVQKQKNNIESTIKSVSKAHEHKNHMLLNDLFQEGLQVIRKRFQQSQKNHKIARKQQCQRNKDDLDELENFYKMYFESMMMSIKEGDKEIERQKKAQDEILRKFKQEYREQVEEELKFLNQLTIRKSQDLQHYRDIDVERFKQKHFQI